MNAERIRVAMREEVRVSTKSTLLRAALLLHMAAISLIHAQIRSATITGSVKDASGAVVAHALVSIANQETGINASETSTPGIGTPEFNR